MLPPVAIDSFLVAVELSLALAAEGDVAGGYECLVAAQQRALGPEGSAAEAGNGRGDLELLWQQALIRYVRRWGTGAFHGQ